jgi:polygalacturonase
MSDQHAKRWYEVTDFGNNYDESIQSTKAIQAAINKCNENGGGIIHFPAGKYICGTLILKSNIILQISAGTTLLFNEERQNFLKPEKLSYKTYADFETSYFQYSLLLGENIENVVIEGGGVIENLPYQRGGPKPIALKLCKNITIRNITIRNAPNYAISLLSCENITINNIKIIDAQADGIDFDNCHQGQVFHCYIDAFDDAICLKTSLALGTLSNTSNISIMNCKLASSCNGFKLGTESNGDFKKISFSNCKIVPRKKARNAIAGIAIESVDGANIQDIKINKITIEGANCPIFLRLGYRGRGKNPTIPGTLTNISITDIVIRNATFPCIFTGIPDHPITNINLKNLKIEYNEIKNSPREIISNEIYHRAKKVKTEQSLFNVPEAIRNYPEADMFGSLPSWSIYGRHLKNFSFYNTIIYLKPKARYFNVKPCVIFEMSCNLELNGIEISIFGTKNEDLKKKYEEIYYIIWFNQVSIVNIKRYRIKYPLLTGIRISGKDTKSVLLKLRKLMKKTIIKMDPDVSTKEVIYEK